jgi:hypothetical protein
MKHKWTRPRRRTSMGDAGLAFLMAVLGASAGCSKKAEVDRPAGLPPAPGAATTTGTSPPTPPTLPSAPPAAVDDQTVAPPVDAKAAISGTITLPAARRKDVARTDTLFIIARRAGAPPGPGSLLAVQRHLAGDFPMPFTLSGRDAMVPGTPFEGALDITVRVDKDGDGLTRRKGDLSGQANGVRVGAQGVTIPVDTVQAQDLTLPGPPPGSTPGQGHIPLPGGPPPGLPAGHP